MHNRLRNLALLQSCDHERSWTIRCPAIEVLNVEKLLHNRLRSYRRDDLIRADGYTEWFDTACYPQLLALLQQLADAMGYTMEPLRVKELLQEPARLRSQLQTRPVPLHISLQPLRPWLAITERFAHTLGYVFDTQGTMHLYLDAQGQDALDIRNVFADDQRIEPPYLGFKAKQLSQCGQPIGGTAIVHRRFDADKPTLSMKLSIRTSIMRCNADTSGCNRAMVPAYKRISAWIHEQLRRGAIRQLSEREVRHYSGRTDQCDAAPWISNASLNHDRTSA